MKTSKPKIIITDDEENIRFGFEMILSEQGYDVMTAPDYDSTLKILSEVVPDLLITDIILGGSTGMDLLQEVKNRGLACPVIVIAGEPNIETSAEAVRLGAFDYIPKPIRRDKLTGICKKALEHKQLLDHKRALQVENARVRHHMEAIFESLKDGIVTVDNRFNVMEGNVAFGKICGVSPKALEGKPFDGDPTGCSRSCAYVLRKALETNSMLSDINVECRHPQKPEQMALLTATPLKSERNGNANGALMVIRDITRLTHLERQLEKRHQFHKIIGKSHAMQKIYSLLDNLSGTDSTILITGETGTGKELVAHAAHYNSTRKEHPFIKVNCSALSENLLESELFGHVKGAFTGALSDKQGRFQMADHGTIFLDEIGDLSPLIQLKLLRVLQEREFERVGDAKPIQVDVRIVTATNCDLKKKVERGTFREDLYYRIKVVDLPLPPLRERREDILLLADHFLNLFNKRFSKQIEGCSTEVIQRFMNYPWPGNVREFKHAIEHGFVLCPDTIIRVAHLPVEIRAYCNPLSSDTQYWNDGSETSYSKPSSALSKGCLLETLKNTDWNKSKAARQLGIGRRTLYRKIEAFNISQPPN